jgi:hypothetical protein
MSQAAGPHHVRVESLYQHVPHPRVFERRKETAVQTEDQRLGFNGKVGLIITTVVGTMWCAYVFSGLALVSLRAALQSHDLVTIVGWVSQTFIQLVLLPIIIVGQNIQGRTSDRRGEQTFKDAEAILHECMQLQEHLAAQDQVLDHVLTHMEKVLPAPPPA